MCKEEKGEGPEEVIILFRTSNNQQERFGTVGGAHFWVGGMLGELGGRVTRQDGM